MKKRNAPHVGIWNTISWIVLLLLAGCEGWAMLRLGRLAVLPGKYFAILAAILVLFTLLLAVLMFPKIGRHQKSRGIGRRITAYLLCAVIAFGAVFGGRALGKLNETFDHITQTPTVSAYVGVFVLADDPIESIEDASRYTFAITDFYTPDDTAATVQALGELWGTPVLTRTYETVFDMIDGLYAGDVQGLILNEGYLGVLNTLEDAPELEPYRQFETRSRELYQYSVMTTEIPTEVTEPDPTETTLSKEQARYAPFVVYLSGSDTRSSMLAQSRSDVNILAAVNPETKQILLINTPRDYFIPNPAYGGALDKLTHCGLNGTENSAKALGDLYGEKIAYTAQINFTGFETLIDSIGGISIYSESGDGVFLSPGENYMDGERALDFARDRKDYAGGDNARGQHQMMVIEAVVHKLASGSIITRYSEILDSLQGMFVTSMPSDRISELIKMQLEDMSGWNVQSFAVTGTGGSDRPAAMGGRTYAYVMYPNQASVDQASALIQKVMDDGILTAQDVLPQE